MDAIHKMRRLAAHHERMARLDLANAEREHTAQERVVAAVSQDIHVALHTQADDADDFLNRHTYGLRMEMARRGAERRLVDRARDVGDRRDGMRVASREKGTLDKLIERRDADAASEHARLEQRSLDETGLQGWWRRP